MKRAISFIAACILLLSMNLNVFAAINGEDTYNEKLYTDACLLINSLNAGVSVSENSMDSDITRIELLRDVYKLLNKGAQLENTYNGSLALTDVAESDKGYLEFAAYCGLINYRDIYFYPDKSADFQFAERTLLCLISYYNDNTINRSLKNDLIKGIRNSAFSSLKAGDVYVMIYNLLMSSEPYGVFNGTPILKELYNIEKAKVKLIGDSLSSYSGYAAEGRVKVEFQNGVIEDMSYSGETKELLGRYVNMFYNKEEECISLMTPYKTDDIIAEFNEEQFETYDASSRKIYWKEFKSGDRWDSTYVQKKADIPKSTDIIYNGVFVSDQNSVYDILENNTANIDKIQLIRTGNTSKIDLIKIDAYTTAYVENVNTDGYAIRDKVSGRLIILDPNDDVEEITVKDTDDNPIAFGSIASKSVISIFDIPGPKQRYKLIVSKNTMDGTISTLQRNEKRRSIIADGIEYQIANGLSVYADNMQLNISYILHTDHNGLIAGYEIGSLGIESVGGIISMAFNESDYSFNFRIYTISGEVKEFTTRNNFKVNGVKAVVNDGFTITVRNEEDFDQTMSIVEFKKYVQKGLVQYKLDGEGKIRDLIMPRKGAKPGNIGYTMGMNNPEGTIENPTNGRMRYKLNNKLFIPDQGSAPGNYNFSAVKADTKVIKIPSSQLSDRENYFSLGSADEFRNDYKAPVLAYTFAGENAVTADIIAIVQGGSSAPSDTVFYIVKKIMESVNKEDNIGNLIQCVNAQTGAEEEFTTATKKFPEYGTGTDLKISVGDIIQIGTNAYGDAASFKLKYRCSTREVENKNDTNWYADMRLVKGEVYSVGDSHFTYICLPKNEQSIDPSKEYDLQIGTCKSVISVVKNDDRDDYDIKVGTPSSLVGYSENPDNYSRIIYITIYGEVRACIEYK